MRNKRKTKITKKRTNTSKNITRNPFADEFVHLRKEIKKAYSQLEKDLKAHASPKTLQKDNNQLFLLLGECHYLARQAWQKTHPKRK